MKIYFFKTSSDNRKITKELTPVIIDDNNDLNIIFKQDVNRSDGFLDLRYNEHLLEANYCFIEDLGYYYYMSEPTFSNNRLLYNLTTDLLMTFKNDILQLKCIIARQQHDFNAYLTDNRFPVLNKQQVNTIDFPDGFPQHDEVILVVNGN